MSSCPVQNQEHRKSSNHEKCAVFSNKLKVLLIFYLFIQLWIAAPFATVQAQDTSTIVGGEEAEEGEWPWIVAIVKQGVSNNRFAQICAGTLIDREWVLTAAHCTFGRTPEELEILITNGSLNDPESERIAVKQIVRSPHYNRSTSTADIALIQLERSLNLPIAVLINAFDQEMQQDGVLTRVVGWGRTSHAVRTSQLHQVDVPLANQETCRIAYEQQGYEIDSTMLCAGLSEGGKDACTGDSGGPLLIPRGPADSNAPVEWLLAGIISWGKGCAQPNAYGVYTRVSEFIPWIYYHIAQQETTSETVDGTSDDVSDDTLGGTTTTIPLPPYEQVFNLNQTFVALFVQSDSQ
ncbi:MAG: serine protease [Chloroflexota bacterium]